jgi:hypothetical protein
MSKNPYASAEEVPRERVRTFSFQKLFWLGFAIVLVSFFCFCFFLNQAFLPPVGVIDSTPELDPASLAREVSVSLRNVAVTMLTGAAGLAVLLIGLFRSRKSS